MDLITLLIFLIVVVVLVFLALYIIDRTFTGPLAEWAWVAKIIVGIIVLIAIVFLLLQITGGPNLLTTRIGK